MAIDSRWGLVPRQAPLEHFGFGFIQEGRLWKWETFEIAKIGAACLGVSPYSIATVGVIIPGPEPEPEFAVEWPSPYRILGQNGEMRALPPSG